MTSLSIFALPGLPEFQPGDDLATAILDGYQQAGETPDPGDILVVTQKIVSKVEGRIVDLATVQPSPFAEQHAQRFGKDARTIELVLRECRRIVRMDRGVLITETHHGLVCANSGIDASNVATGFVTLLPVDSDGSARRLRDQIKTATGHAPAVIIADTFGRPWRDGLTNVAIGVAGIAPIRDFRGQHDPFGNPLQVTALAIADELASAAELVMGKIDAAPVAVIRGYSWTPDDTANAQLLVRQAEMDMFR